MENIKNILTRAYPLMVGLFLAIILFHVGNNEVYTTRSL